MIVATTIAVATLGVGALSFAQLVREYGFKGALRYIWEGEAYSSDIQTLLNTLNDAQEGRDTQESRLSAIEEALERARLDSVDDARATKAIVLRWIENYRPNNLETTLADLSDKLDKLASKVDSVALSEAYVDSPRVLQDIRRRKKLLSKQLVLDMERCDAFLACYHVLRE